MQTTVNCDKQRVINFIKSNGYRKQNSLEGFVKKVRGGRLHLIVKEFNNQIVIDIHYDKFKGNKDKKFKHSVVQMNPLIKNDLDYIKKHCK